VRKCGRSPRQPPQPSPLSSRTSIPEGKGAIRERVEDEAEESEGLAKIVSEIIEELRERSDVEVPGNITRTATNWPGQANRSTSSQERDVHDRFDGLGTFGPGEFGYVAQLKAYNKAWGQFFARLKADGITADNTLFGHSRLRSSLSSHHGPRLPRPKPNARRANPMPNSTAPTRARPRQGPGMPHPQGQFAVASVPGQRVEVNTAVAGAAREFPASSVGPRRRACGVVCPRLGGPD
jgi:hypothetical protein